MRNYQHFEKVKRISKIYKIEEEKVEEIIELVYDCLEAEDISKEANVPLYKIKKILNTEYVKCNRIINRKKLRNLAEEEGVDMRMLRFVNGNMFSNKENTKKFNSVKGYYLNQRYLSDYLYVPNEWLSEYEYNLLSTSTEDYYEKE